MARAASGPQGRLQPLFLLRRRIARERREVPAGARERALRGRPRVRRSLDPGASLPGLRRALSESLGAWRGPRGRHDAHRNPRGKRGASPPESRARRRGVVGRRQPLERPGRGFVRVRLAPRRFRPLSSRRAQGGDAARHRDDPPPLGWRDGRHGGSGRNGRGEDAPRPVRRRSRYGSRRRGAAKRGRVGDRRERPRRASAAVSRRVGRYRRARARAVPIQAS